MSTAKSTSATSVHSPMEKVQHFLHWLMHKWHFWVGFVIEGYLSFHEFGHMIGHALTAQAQMVTAIFCLIPLIWLVLHTAGAIAAGGGIGMSWLARWKEGLISAVILIVLIGIAKFCLPHFWLWWHGPGPASDFFLASLIGFFICAGATMFLKRTWLAYAVILIIFFILADGYKGYCEELANKPGQNETIKDGGGFQNAGGNGIGEPVELTTPRSFNCEKRFFLESEGNPLTLLVPGIGIVKYSGKGRLVVPERKSGPIKVWNTAKPSEETAFRIYVIKGVKK